MLAERKRVIIMHGRRRGIIVREISDGMSLCLIYGIEGGMELECELGGLTCSRV